MDYYVDVLLNWCPRKHRRQSLHKGQRNEFVVTMLFVVFGDLALEYAI